VTKTLTGSLTDRDSWRGVPCSAARALEILSTPSSLIVLREAFYGTTYFQDFVREAKLSEPALAKRLRDLVASGLLERVPYQESGQRGRHRYQLTSRGLELMTTLFSLMDWGDRHLAPDGGPVRLRHRYCDAPAHVELRCEAGHTVPVAEVEVVPGPAIPAKRKLT
jgi:DNA-binding HxlR family transcriptional regulator